ncbi:MAG: putative DNA binding domain-containing protein [Nitrospirae bacterium]|nr:putative DNA binding domain-containing protein [Nitrospirota bacterium]
MKTSEIKEIIAKGEGHHTEFKEMIIDNEETAKTITSFANTDGGKIFLGVADNGDITGIEDVDETIRRIDDIAFNRCEPPITVLQETVNIDDKMVLIVNIPKGEQRPYRTIKGIYYVRSANRCRQASREELLRLFQSAGDVFYDETEIYKAAIDDLDRYFFKSFVKEYLKLEATERLSENYMRNLRVLSSGGKPTLTGLLFFGENPQSFYPHAKVVAAYIDGKDISVPPMDKKEITGKMHQVLENSMNFLRLYLTEEHRIKDLEPEVFPEIPTEALREALVNAVAHRDYTISSPIRIFIFRDRIEFRTPGKLPNTVTIESMKMGGAHVLRNPTIYNLLAKMGLVTDIGSGVLRIIESVKKAIQKEVKFDLIDTEFILTIPRKKPAE